MSGEAGGFFGGVALIAIGGPFLITTAIVGAVVGATAIGALGVGKLALETGKPIIGRKRGIRGFSLNSQKITDQNNEYLKIYNDEYLKKYNESEEKLIERINQLNKSRKECYEIEEKFFEEEKNLERFINFVEDNNKKCIADFKRVRDELINEFDLSTKLIIRNYEDEYMKKSQSIRENIEYINLNKNEKKEKSRESAKEFREYVKNMLKSVEENYPVDILNNDFYQLIKEEFEALSEELLKEKENYEDIIIAINAMPLRIIEYVNKCDKEILGRQLYYNACLDKLNEIEKLFSSDVIERFEFDLSDVYVDLNEKERINIKDYMCYFNSNEVLNTYEEIENKVENYKRELESGFVSFAENELVHKYVEIVELHTYVVNEMFAAVERYRNACMRDEMNASIIPELQDLGYIIESENDIKNEVCYSSVRLVHPETKDTIELRIEESFGADNKLKKEINNKVKILHNSPNDNSDLILIEEHRKEIRERVSQSCDKNINIAKNHYRLKNLACNMETYKQMRFRREES